jgi:hypothetical protein
VEVGQVRAGQNHPVHELLHLLVAALFDVRYLPLVAVVSGALPKEQMELLRSAPPQHLAQSRLVVSIGRARHTFRF